MREQLTVLIPCKNERGNIRPCIDSVRDLADEILVADSGSTDGTLGIVRGLGGCRVIQREYVSHGSFVNWALPQATHAWVLIVDADERVSSELARAVRDVLASPDPDTDAYWISFKSFFMGHPLRFARWNTDALRLVRRDWCRHRECLVHPEFQVPRRRTRKLSGKLLHYSYWSYDQYLLKYQTYTRLVAQEKWAEGKRASFTSLLLRPMLRFLHLYVVRLGFCDGLAGLQVCMLTAFFNTFIKQGRLWEMEHAPAKPGIEAATLRQFPSVGQAARLRAERPRAAA